MPFVTDIYPQSPKIEALAALGLALEGRKSKGFLGKRQHEVIEVLGSFSVPLRTASWDMGAEGCKGVVFSPQGLLTGQLRLDLLPADPQIKLEEKIGEEEFVDLCQKVTKQATDTKGEALEMPGLITEPDQVMDFLKDNIDSPAELELEHTVDGGKLVEQLRKIIDDFENSSSSWLELRQEIVSYRDNLTVKINEAIEEARAASSKSLTELEQQVKSAKSAKGKELDQSREKAREEHRKEKELLQQELERFREQFKETGDEYWREKIQAEEKRMTEIDKKLATALAEINEVEKKFASSQQERIKQFEAEKEKRFAAFQQRLKRLDVAVSGLERGIEKRVERNKEQQKRISSLAVSLTPDQCESVFQVIFYAARYPGNRWQVFPPQLYGSRGIKGKLSGLVGGLNLPFRSASKVGEQIAGKVLEMLPESALEKTLVEGNLMDNEEFIEVSKEGLLQLIDQGDINKKHASLLDDF